MQIVLARLLQRIFVLLVGVLAVYIAAWQVLPIFSHRLPITFALLATYIVMAYGVLPLAIRLLHLFTQPTHIPVYCVTPDGFASDPINIGIVGTRAQVVRAMAQSGWYLADRRTPQTVARMMGSFLLRIPYPNAPFSTLYLFGRKQDLGFELPIDGRILHRHHVRFWACNLRGPEEFHADVHFWRRFHRPRPLHPTYQLWVGAASKDIGIAPIRHNAQLTHKMAADTNAERELIVEHLKAAKVLNSSRTISVNGPYSLPNRAFRSLLRTDGKLTICELKEKLPTTSTSMEQ